MKALLLENIHQIAVDQLRERGFEVETRPGALGEDDLVEALQDVDLLGIRSGTHVTRAVLEQAPRLEAVGCFCIGTNQVDLEAAAERGVPVFNAPYSNTRSVVELALGEIISMARRLSEKNNLMHAGVWDKSAKGAHEVRGRTLGIIGYGNIGSQLSVLAEALGMRVIFFDLSDKLALGNARRCDTLEELLREADTVTLHVDGRSSNAGVFGREQFQMMKPRSMFLNLSRGMVVDQAALVEALQTGHLAGAALDVFAEEPARAGDPFVSPLQGIPNVILTPHVGGSTAEAQHDIGRFVAGKLGDFAETGATNMSVNLPQVVVNHEPEGVRILQVHKNIPGSLARLNTVFANHGANITYQSLATRAQLGYVVTDLSELPQALADDIRNLPETVRFRVLGAQ